VVDLLAALLDIVAALRIGGAAEIAGEGVVEGDQEAEAAGTFDCRSPICLFCWIHVLISG
jgi:hypothetical protein